MNYTVLFTGISLFAGILSVFLIVGTLRSEKGPLRHIAIFLFSLLCLYCVGYAIELQGYPLDITLRIISIEYICISLAPVLLLAFLLTFQGTSSATIRTLIPYLLIIPGITLIIAWTELITPLLYLQAWMDTSSAVPGFSMIPGVWWYVITIWNASLLLAGLLILIRMLLSRDAVYRNLTLLMAIGVAAPFSSLFLNNYLRASVPIDVTPFTLVITGLAVYPAITSYYLLNIVPASHAVVFKTLASGLIVLDGNEQIREINPAAEAILQVSRSDLLGTPVRVHLPIIPGRSQAGRLEDRRGEIEISREGRIEFYLVDQMTVDDRNPGKAGSVLMLTNITEHKEREDRLREYTGIIEMRTSEIQAAYQQLEENQQALKVSEQSLRKAQSIARLGVCEWDSIHGRTYASEEFREIFAPFFSDVPETVLDIMQVVSSSDQDKVSAAFSALLSSGTSCTTEFWIEKPGVRRAIRGQGEREYSDDNIPGSVTLIVQDITERKLMEEQIREAYKEKETLLREIHHRVKNNMQVISSLLSMQSRTITDPAIQELFKETQSRVRSLALVHEQLYQSQNLSKINYHFYLQRITSHYLQSYGALSRSISCILEVDDVELPLDTAVPCSLVISELLTNSFKYAFPDGRPGEIRIRFSYQEDENLYRLEYSDNGKGFSGSVQGQTTGIGSMLITGLINQLSGSIEVDMSGPGVHYLITFPGKKVRLLP